MGNHIQIIFDLIPTLDPATILNQALSRIGGSSSDDSKYQALENYLNSMIYGVDGGSQAAGRLANVTTQYLENKFQAAYDTYDFSQNMLTSEAARQDKIIGVEGYQSFQHSKYIECKTVQERILAAQEAIKIMVEEGKDATPQLHALQALINIGKSILNASDEMIAGAVMPGKVDVTADNRQLITQLDELWQALTFVRSLPVDNQTAGDLFEKALHVVSTGKSFDEMTDDMLYETFMQETAGAKVVSRGGLIHIDGVKIEGPSTQVSKDGSKKISYQITGDNGSTLTIQGAFDEKQGKMDVLMTMPNSDDTFRASAKNWTSFKHRDFGTTRLSYAILRSAGLNDLFAYGFGLGWSEYSGDISKLHNFAKMAVLVDILMGYSQESGYADTIVINNRSHAHVYVYSMRSLLDKAASDLTNLKLIGYNDTEIANSINLDFSHHLDNQNYMQSIYSSLSAFQISVGSGILK